MKAIKCELCGSNEFVKENDYFVCQYCNTKYSKEEAQKMIVEINGKVDVSGSIVKVDTSNEVQNLYKLARRAKDDDNTENAQKYYGEILVKDPSSWEANFYNTYYQSINCKIGEIGVASNRISNCESTVFNLIKENITDLDEQRKAVYEVATKLIYISSMLFNVYKNHYDNIDIQIKGSFVQDYANNCYAATEIVYNGGNLIERIFEGKYCDIAAECWKLGVEQHNILNKVFINKQSNADVMKEYNNKISKYDSTYQAPTINMGGCYIATCVYGTYDCPEVWTLRRYRDLYLDSVFLGKAFIKLYYFISPKIIKIFGQNTNFKKLNKSILDKWVKKLNNKGYENTPYNDKH